MLGEIAALMFGHSATTTGRDIHEIAEANGGYVLEYELIPCGFAPTIITKYWYMEHHNEPLTYASMSWVNGLWETTLEARSFVRTKYARRPGYVTDIECEAFDQLFAQIRATKSNRMNLARLLFGRSTNLVQRLPRVVQARIEQLLVPLTGTLVLALNA